MRRILRLLLPVASFVGLGAVGVLAARAVLDDEPVAATRPSSELVALGTPSTEPVTTGTLTAAELAPAPDHMIPVVAPVAVGAGPDDLGPGEALDDAAPPSGNPVAASGTGAAPNVIGAIAADLPVPTDGDLFEAPPTTAAPAADDAPFTLDGDARFALLTDVDRLEFVGRIAFDPCAGAAPGSTPPEDCAPGYAATFDGALGPTPPRPFIFLNPGYFVADPATGVHGCAAAPPRGEELAEMMLTTHTPLSEAHMRYRAYGSSEAWVEYDIGATAAEDVASWNADLASADFDVIESMLSTCFSVPRDPTIPYEYEAWGTDVYGRAVVQDAQPRLLPADNPTLRPVMTAEITGLTPVAHVKAWSTFGGSVVFRSRYVTAPDDALSCEGMYEIPESQRVRDVGRPEPAGLYDPRYGTGFGAAIPLIPGARVLVCADILPGSNPFLVDFTDRLVLTAPSQEQPRIVLQSIRRAGDATIPNGSIGVNAGDFVTTGSFGSCDGGTSVPELAAGRTHTLESVVWECSRAPVPVDADGNLMVPLRVTRRVGSGDSTRRIAVEVAIPVHVSGCRLPEGCQGREWFEVPIPMERGGLCGSSFGLGCETPTDGIMVFRVDYPMVAGLSGGDGVVSALDAIVPGLPEAPRVSPPEFRPTDGDDPFHADLGLSLVTDRPLQITVTPIELLPDGVTAPCADLTPVTSSGFSDRPSVQFDELCRGRTYGFDLLTVDGAGDRHEMSYLEAGSALWYRFSHAVADTTIALELFGGDGLPALGYFADIKVLLDGVQQTNYWWENRTLLQGTAQQCLGLNGTTFEPNGPTAAPLFPDDMTVEVSVRITTTGDADCSVSDRTGLGTISFTTTLRMDQLVSHETIVLNSPPDSRLRMQLRITFGDWRRSETDP